MLISSYNDLLSNSIKFIFRIFCSSLLSLSWLLTYFLLIHSILHLFFHLHFILSLVFTWNSLLLHFNFFFSFFLLWNNLICLLNLRLIRCKSFPFIIFVSTLLTLLTFFAFFTFLALLVTIRIFFSDKSLFLNWLVFRFLFFWSWGCFWDRWPDNLIISEKRLSFFSDSLFFPTQSDQIEKEEDSDYSTNYNNNNNKNLTILRLWFWFWFNIDQLSFKF